jgi:N4-gp56 family major capsid protein
MATQTTANLTSAIGTRYTLAYQRAAEVERLYDQLATPIGAPQFELESRRGLGTTYTFQFLSDMSIVNQTVSEDDDIATQILRDATATITPTSRADGLRWSQLLDLSVFTDYVAGRAEVLGRNMMETVDNQARNAALQGSLVVRAAARASLDAGTATHNWTEAGIWAAMSTAESLKCPPYVDFRGRNMFMAIGHPDAYYDLFHGGNVVSAAIYGGLPGSLLFNGELGEIANCKLIISPSAKVFGAAGADHASAMNTGSGYTMSAAANALATSIGVTTATNIGSGRFLTIGTEETGATHYDDNERVKHVSGTTTSVIVGQGANGGLRFDHALGTTVYNNDSVYPVAYGSPKSLVKVFAAEVGEFGELVGPNKTGTVEQWTTLAWKWFGAYGRMAENYLIRGEYSSSLDA